MISVMPLTATKNGLPSRGRALLECRVRGRDVEAPAVRVGLEGIGIAGCSLACAQHQDPVGCDRLGQALEVVGLALLARELDPVVVDPPVRHGEHGLEHLGAELLRDPLDRPACRALPTAEENQRLTVA